MHPSVVTTLALFSIGTLAANVVLSNDDGWAEKNIRVFYNALTAAGNDVVISAPADNKSGTGSSDGAPTRVGNGCQFNSCPAGSPAIGRNASEPRFNYVNSYPVTAIRYGIQNVSEQFFDGPPDIAVAGPNVGGNLGFVTRFSGTVGAATEASLEGVPGIAFSGDSGSQVAWTTSTQIYQTVYADLSTQVTQTLLASGKPYLPDGIWLNVNYPAIGTNSCNSAKQFKFVLSRINSASSSTAPDIRTCGSTRLPTESSVIDTNGCYASISVGIATNKGDARSSDQAIVLSKLRSILSCLA
ncbi:unnamed protein product [Discula destructiva]